MAKIEGSVTINRPIDEVFEFMHTPENDPMWQPEVIESRADGPMDVGTTLTIKRKVMAREVEATAEVAEYDPPHKSGVKSKTGPVSFEGGYFLQEVEGGTQVQFHGEVEPSGIFKLAAGAFASQIQKEFEANLKRLKDLLES